MALGDLLITMLYYFKKLFPLIFIGLFLTSSAYPSGGSEEKVLQETLSRELGPEFLNGLNCELGLFIQKQGIAKARKGVRDALKVRDFLHRMTSIFIGPQTKMPPNTVEAKAVNVIRTALEGRLKFLYYATVENVSNGQIMLTATSLDGNESIIRLTDKTLKLGDVILYFEIMQTNSTRLTRMEKLN